jgi:hypothetical protein
MKVELLCLDSVNKHQPFLRLSQRFESVYTLQGKNLTTRHTRAKRAPQVAIVHNVIKESGRVVPRPSAVFDAYASADTPWLA